MHFADGGFKVPTWLGLELNGGYEQNQGVLLNPEHSTPGNGLWYAGLSLALGQGLFIDERRAGLQQAQIYSQATETQRQQMLNTLLYKAGVAYWAWFESYNQLRVYQEALELTKTRLAAVRQGALLGDRAAIDTLEAGIQFQNRMLALEQAQLRLCQYLFSAIGLPMVRRIPSP
ncbi:MAG: TolC family protein [Owenweeksia sp.]|nr:TolC family protein [Owenweeksia sp.]